VQLYEHMNENRTFELRADGIMLMSARNMGCFWTGRKRGAINIVDPDGGPCLEVGVMLKNEYAMYQILQIVKICSNKTEKTLQVYMRVVGTTKS
jgi:tRNA 2-selenouridine synthase SelU